MCIRDRCRGHGLGRLPVGDRYRVPPAPTGGAHILGGARTIPPDPPELVGQAIVLAIRTGEAHVLVSDPPRPIVPGDDEGWGALLARQSPEVSRSPGDTPNRERIAGTEPTEEPGG